ncbi:Transposase [Bacillus thuringiensis serovar israelensis ATCC 35646]|nr:Transposase [Bacillus thuringiensis serovar israelensis ATCC 35646]
MAALCIWISQHVASDSLTRLCSQLYTNTATLISPEGLNQRFNPAAVAFYFPSHTKTLFKSLTFCTYNLYFQSYPYSRCNSVSTT